MDINDALNKTKEAFAVAKDKTVEVVNLGKMKYDVACLEKELDKLYTRLGKEAFEKLSTCENADEQIKATVGAIENKKKEICKAKQELLKVQEKRLCPKCNAAIDENAVFCSFCGEKIIFSEE